MGLDHYRKGISLHLSATTKKKPNLKPTFLDKKNNFIWATQNQNNG